jgi:predicted outer membrane repeat protein
MKAFPTSRFLTAAVTLALVAGSSASLATPVYAVVPPGTIDSAWIHFVNEDDVVHYSEEIEADGHDQLYLSTPSRVFELELDLSEDEDDHDLGDSFELQLTNGAFAGSYTTTVTAGNVDAGACTTTWNAAGVGGGTLVGAVDCDGAAVNHGTTIPFAIIMPASGPAILEVDTVGEDFKVYFFAAEAGDEIYVGSGTVADGDASCADGTADFTTDAGGHGSIQGALMAAFMAVDDDEDTIVICDGAYTYSGDFGVFDGEIFHDTITLTAETSGGVELDGGAVFDINDPMEGPSSAGHQLISTYTTNLDVSGLIFRGGERTDGDEDPLLGGGAIQHIGGELSISDSVFVGNVGYFGGAVNILFGALEVRNVSATGNLAQGGGAFVTISSVASIEDSTFVENLGLMVGGAVLNIASTLEVSKSRFSQNKAWSLGGALGSSGGDLLVNRVQFDENVCLDITSQCAGGAIGIAHLSLFDTDITAEIRGSQFRGNQAIDGGAIYAEDFEQLTIASSKFQRNTALEQGGAIRVQSGTPLTAILSNTFTQNVAEQGGGLSINDGPDDAYLWTIRSNTFDANRASMNGGALHMALDNSGNVVAPNVQANQFKKNTAPAAGAVVVESDYGTERTILKRYEQALRGNRFQANRATNDRRSANIGVHFDE